MKRIIKILSVFLLLIFHLLPKGVLAIPPGPQPPPPAQNPLGGIKPPEGIPKDVGALGSFIGAIIQLLVIAAVVVTFIILLIGGIQYATAGGDPKNTAAARAKVAAGIIGLIITLSTFAIIGLIEFFFDIKILKFTLPTF